MKGENWNSKVIGSISPNGHKISSEVAAGIFNHYYTEAGYDLNELSGKTVDPQIENNACNGWQDVGETKYGPLWGLGSGEYKISAEKMKIGGTLKTQDDFISLFVHERGSHIADFLKNDRAGLNPYYDKTRDASRFERNAIKTQLSHESWKGTSLSFRKVIYDYAVDYLYTPELK